jgi:hypothetical protein
VVVHRPNLNHPNWNAWVAERLVIESLPDSEHLACSDAEQVGHRARVAERRQGGGYPVLDGAPVADKVEPGWS